MYSSIVILSVVCANRGMTLLWVLYCCYFLFLMTILFCWWQYRPKSSSAGDTMARSMLPDRVLLCIRCCTDDYSVMLFLLHCCLIVDWCDGCSVMIWVTVIWWYCFILYLMMFCWYVNAVMKPWRIHSYGHAWRSYLRWLPDNEILSRKPMAAFGHSACRLWL